MLTHGSVLRTSYPHPKEYDMAQFPLELAVTRAGRFQSILLWVPVRFVYDHKVRYMIYT